MTDTTRARIAGHTHAAKTASTVRRWQEELLDGKGRTVGPKGLWL